MKLTGKSRRDLVKFFLPACPTDDQRSETEHFVDLVISRSLADTNDLSSAEWQALVLEAKHRVEAGI